MAPQVHKGTIIDTCAAEPSSRSPSGPWMANWFALIPYQIVEGDVGSRPLLRRRDAGRFLLDRRFRRPDVGVALGRHRLERVERQQRRDLLEIVDDGEVFAEVRKHQDRESKPCLEHVQLGFLRLADPLLDLNLRFDDVGARRFAPCS